MNSSDYISGKEATKILGVHRKTLHNWDRKKKIEVIRASNGKRLYNVKKFINDNTNYKNMYTENLNINNKKKYKICYCRVSSVGQKNDLVRQIDYMKSKFPNHLLITDIASGLNFKRIGLRTIINMAISGEIEEIVIAHKDRLARHGYDLIEYLVKKYSNGKIIIINKKQLEPEAEIIEDMLQIMNVYIAKMNGMRKYRKKLKVNNIT